MITRRQRSAVAREEYSLPHGAFRPPAVPLVTHDPYFSTWSMADHLTDDVTRHWTGVAFPLCGLIRIDGEPFRFIGTEPADLPALDQTSLEVLPTRTVYQFGDDRIALTLTFLSPLLPENLDLLSWPATYVTMSVRSLDGRLHQASLYLDLQPAWVVNNPEQDVEWNYLRVGDVESLQCGSASQPVLQSSGDDQRIDWGYLYVATASGEGSTLSFTTPDTARASFCATGQIPVNIAAGGPLPASAAPSLCCLLDCDHVWKRTVSRRLILAYDDIHSIEYLGQKLRPYWRRHGIDAAMMLEIADRDYVSVVLRCEAFDTRLMADLRLVGGEGYARMAALAYRQCMAAHKLAASPTGEPMFFSKENFSGGCIATVDVTYPSSPFFLLFNPGLLRAQLLPVLAYARSPRWPFPFAPHALGFYPRANGQVYGGGERSERDQMPVEECGNMLILVAAAAYADGDTALAREYWPLLGDWAEYLLEHGLDPDSQLCTDDFAGHLARNTNLSLKSIVALGAFAGLARTLGKRDDVNRFRHAAKEMAAAWLEMAGDGDHSMLAFDCPGTWSQKYNLVWDRVLQLELFPAELYRAEVAYYRRQMNPLGLPLDSRNSYTKLDWCVWTATLADRPEDFRALLYPAYRFAHESPDRVPLTDWYWTVDGGLAGLFRARSVVGGIYMPMVADAVMWERWREPASGTTAGPSQESLPALAAR